ncbi:MAG: DUF2934 domain-containing protein [Vicinamibacterales bacterium]
MTVKKTTPTRTRKTAGAAKTPTTTRPAATRARTARTARPSAAAKTAAASAAPAVPTPPRAVSDEDIRVRAYFLALEHQGRGDSRDFWLQAERELRAAARSGR